MSSEFKRTVYVAYTNTDCTEGRGHDVPIAVCDTEATAIRMARGQYVQGSDGPVRDVPLMKVCGNWMAPISIINIIPSTKEDEAAQARIEAKRHALSKALAAGLTEDDIKALGARHE